MGNKFREVGKRKRIWLKLGLCFGFFLLLFTGGVFFRFRGSVPAEPLTEIPAGQVVFYRQDGQDWKDEKLGGSEFTMEFSGCLTACIASVLEMEEAGPRAGEPMNPGELNRLFSENQVYDSQGNIQWGPLEQVLGLKVQREDGREVSAGNMEGMLSRGVFPIARVRMKGVGSFHYVVVVQAGEGQFWCMDPLKQEGELVPLSEYGGRIYAVRYLMEKEES